MAITNRAVIDLRLPADFSVTIGGVNITANVLGGSISKPEFNPSSKQAGDFKAPVLLWEGTIEIRQTRSGNRGVVGGAGISFDARNNPNFKAWAQPIVVVAEGQTICTVRLAKDCRLASDGTATLELKHLAYSLKGQAPRVIRQFSGFGISQPYGQDLNINVRTWDSYAKNIITNAVDANGESVYADTDIDFSDGAGLQFLNNTYSFGGARAVNGFSSEQPGQEDLPIDKANKIVFSAVQRCIESRGDEKLYLSAEFPKNQGTPIISLAPQQLLTADPLFVDPDDPDEEGANADKIIVTTRAIRRNKDLPPPSQRVSNPDGIDDDDDPEIWPKIISIPGIHPVSNAPIIVETRTENEPASPIQLGTVGTRTQTKTVVSARFYVLGTGTDTSNITRESTTRVEKYALNRIPTVLNNKIIEVTETRTVLLHDLNRDLFEGDLTQVTETTTETWEYNTLGNTTQYLKILTQPRQAVLGGATAGDNTPTVALREGFVRRVIRQGINKQYVEVPFKQIPQGQIDGTDTDTLVADPDFDVATNIKIQKEVASPQPTLAEEPVSYLLGSANANFASDAPNPRTFRTSSLAATLENGQGIADTIGAAIQQRRQALDVEHALTPLINYRCFQRVNLDNGIEAMQGHIVGPRVEFDNRSIRLGYTAYKIGELASRITLPKLPVVASQYQQPLAIAAIGNRTTTASFVVGVPIIPIPLAAFNGTEPYSFGATGLPAGLSVVGSQIVGTPTGGASSGTVTVTVTDAALDTAQATFTLAVVEQPAVIPHYIQLALAQSQIEIDVTSTIELVEEDQEVAINGRLICTTGASVADLGKALEFDDGDTYTLNITPGFDISIDTAANAIELYRWSQEPNTGLTGREWVADLSEAGGTVNVTINSTYRWISVFALNSGNHDGVFLSWDGGNKVTLYEF